MEMLEWDARTYDALPAIAHLRLNGRLVPDPARFERGEQLEAFIATLILGVQLRDMSSEDRRPFVHEVAQRLPEPATDFVRLQISATRA